MTLLTLLHKSAQLQRQRVLILGVYRVGGLAGPSFETAASRVALVYRATFRMPLCDLSQLQRQRVLIQGAYRVVGLAGPSFETAAPRVALVYRATFRMPLCDVCRRQHPTQ